jgi:hypothetical protein
MLLRGDLNKVFEEVNKVLDVAFKRIQDLEDKVYALENPQVKSSPKNKVREAA